MTDKKEFAKAREAARNGRYSYTGQLIFGPGLASDSVLGYGFNYDPGQELSLARLVQLANARLDDVDRSFIERLQKP